MGHERLQKSLEELERAFDEFRVAYAAWLADGGDTRALSEALARAEEKLDRARSAVASTDDITR